MSTKLAGKAIVPPNYGGEGGLTSSICVIIACDNIHRISPHFVLWLIKEPRGIVYHAASMTDACKIARSHGVSVIVFSDCSPPARGEHEEKRLFQQIRHMCPRITGAEYGLISVGERTPECLLSDGGGFAAVGPIR